MTRNRFLPVTVVLLLASSSAVLAHHSFTAAYEAGKRITVEGVVKEFVWRNPHSFVRVDVTTDRKSTRLNSSHT